MRAGQLRFAPPTHTFESQVKKKGTSENEGPGFVGAFTQTRVRTAEYVFTVRGRRRPRVELKTGVVATKARAQNCPKADVAEACGLFVSLWWQKKGPRTFTATRLKGSSLAVVAG